MRCERIRLVKTLIVISVFLLTSCGGSETIVPDEGALPLVEDETADDQFGMETNTTGVEFEEEELPENFPEVFPIPEYTKVASTTVLPGDNSYRIFLAFPQVTLEEVLTFYQDQLQVNGWSVDAEGPDTTGYGMWITHPEYEAKLAFIEDEEGIVLDLSLAPLGELEEIPGSDETYGESAELGETGGEVPTDFPLPSGAEQIALSEKMASEGYQLAFSFPDLPEMAYIQLSTALMGAGWELGEFDVDLETHVYTLPISQPSSGFSGYAMLTDNGQVLGMDSVSGCVIAIHPGPIE